MRFKYITGAVLALLAIFYLGSCSKSSNTNGNNGYPPVPPKTAISLQLKTDAHFGSVITDSSGNTLYFFSPDANGSSACTGGCLAAWPAFYAANPTFATGLDSSEFAVITRTDGAKQSTYKGWPLYKYAGDASPGDITGDAVGGVWFVAKPDYTIMLAETQLIGNDGISYDSTYKPASGKTIYMTDDHGLTLYAFSYDKSGVNNYTKSDFSNDSFWPIVQISSIQNVPSVLKKSDFASITVFTKPQLTYKGWPVYRFGPDELVRGNTKGVSVPSPGIWPIMDAFSPAAP